MHASAEAVWESYGVACLDLLRLTAPAGTITDCRRNDNETMQQDQISTPTAHMMRHGVCLCLQRQWKGAGSRMVSPIWTGKDRGWPTACQQQAHDASAKQPKPNGLLGGSCRSPQRFWSSSIKSRARRVNQRHSTCCIVSLSFRWQSVIVS